MSPPVLREQVGTFITVEELYPYLKSDSTSLLILLAKLSRNDTLLTCARINTFISGPGTLTDKERQELPLGYLCQPEDLRKINEFVRSRGGANRVTVFFRGQLLELLRWVAKHCFNLPG